RGLAVFIGVAAIFGLAGEAAFHSWDVGSAWPTFTGGFARVWFSFMVGVALARVHAARPPRLHVPDSLIWSASVSLMLSPLTHLAGQAYEPVCVCMLFPALIYLGAGAADRHPVLGSALGDASYAAYTLHIPLLSLVCYLAPGATSHPSE